MLNKKTALNKAVKNLECLHYSTNLGGETHE